jgi:phage gpG-like protein
MTEIRISISGLDDVSASLKEMAVNVKVAANTATIVSGNLVKKTAQTGLALRTHARGTRTPSPPGDAPALISGALRRSIAVNLASYSGMTVAMVGPTIIYGRIQELGGVAGRGHHSHLPARPYLRPALEYSLPAIAEAYRSAWAAALGGS